MIEGVDYKIEILSSYPPNEDYFVLEPGYDDYDDVEVYEFLKPVGEEGADEVQQLLATKIRELAENFHFDPKYTRELKVGSSMIPLLRYDFPGRSLSDECLPVRGENIVAVTRSHQHGVKKGMIQALPGHVNGMHTGNDGGLYGPEGEEIRKKQEGERVFYFLAQYKRSIM